MGERRLPTPLSRQRSGPRLEAPSARRGVWPVALTRAASRIVASPCRGALLEEECAVLGAQSAWPLTVEMGQAPVAEDDGVVRRDHPRALQTRPLLLFRHRSTPDPKGSARCHWGKTPACVNPGAPVLGEGRIPRVSSRCLQPPVARGPDPRARATRWSRSRRPNGLCR
jgi:hypothetical protein